MSVQMNPPLEWIRMECIPLPDSPYQEMVVFWNPNTQEVIGDFADLVLKIVDQAMLDGHLKGNSLSHFEITDPLSKPSELAAVLAQFFWVIPEPVESPNSHPVEHLKNLQ